MPRHHASDHRAVDRLCAWRRAVHCGLLVLGLGLSASAYPITLPQLLRMPLEQLLRLEISVPGASPGLRRSTLTAPFEATEGGRGP